MIDYDTVFVVFNGFKIPKKSAIVYLKSFESFGLIAHNQVGIRFIQGDKRE